MSNDLQFLNGAKEKAKNLRFHSPHSHLFPVFGDNWFALRAEAFARFFGTPLFIALQTGVVILWVTLNLTGVFHFDLYPFILLNLAFSLQAAYAAPLILLAQTRQADRDKALSEADATHREALARASEERQLISANHSEQILELLRQNTELTQVIHGLSQRIENLTVEICSKVKLS